MTGHLLRARVFGRPGKLAGLDKKLSRSLDQEVQMGSSPLELSKSPVGPLAESARCGPAVSQKGEAKILGPGERTLVAGCARLCPPCLPGTGQLDATTAARRPWSKKDHFFAWRCLLVAGGVARRATA